MKGFVRENPPVDDLVWGTAAMGNATSLFHIDTFGFATVVEVLTGAKLWTLADRHRDIDDDDPTGDLSSIHAFGPNWSPTSTGRTREADSDQPRFEFESVLLRPGTIL
jgi:hypothetical protein